MPWDIGVAFGKVKGDFSVWDTRRAYVFKDGSTRVRKFLSKSVIVFLSDSDRIEAG